MSSLFGNLDRQEKENTHAREVLKKLEHQSDTGTLFTHLEERLIPDAGYLESILRRVWAEDQDPKEFPYEVTPLETNPSEVQIRRKRD